MKNKIKNPALDTFSQITQYLNKTWIIFILASLLGAGIFVSFYGYDLINPVNTGWLLAGGDVAQHYIGWQFFREAAWTFPVGVMDNLAYPHGIALTFMDSIPLVAILLKLIGRVPPSEFQYFGYFGLISFMLQAGFAALIVRLWTRSVILPFLGSIMAIASPIMLERMFIHTALAGQWILLCSIWLLFYGKRWGIAKFIIVWSVILSLSVTVHPYFLPMNIFLMLIAIVLSWHSRFSEVFRFVIPIIIAVSVFAVIGGFTISDIQGEQLGIFGYNLLSPVIPKGWSVVVGEFSTFNNTRENLGYLGIGGFMTVSSIIAISVWKRKMVRRFVSKYVKKLTIITLLIAALIIASIGPTVQLAGRIVFSYDTPEQIEKLWSIFRATGRLAWPLYYLLIFTGFYLIIRILRYRYAVSLLIVIVGAQAIDIFNSPMAIFRSAYFHNAKAIIYETPLSSQKWDTVVNNKKHIVYLGTLRNKEFHALSELATKHNLTLNTGYFARTPTSAIQKVIKDSNAKLSKGFLPGDTVYVSDGVQPIYAPTVRQERINDYWVVW